MAANSFNWSEYLVLAEELGIRSADEAALRSAISRAYYYIFHLALQRAERNGFTISRGESSHIKLWMLFTMSPEPACLNMGQIAMRLKEKRERADYNNHFARIAEEIAPIIADARRFEALLSALAPRHPSPGSMRQ